MSDSISVDEIRSRFPDENGFQVVRGKTQTKSFTGSCMQGIWFVINGKLKVKFDGMEPVEIGAGNFAGLPAGDYSIEVMEDEHVEYVKVLIRSPKKPQIAHPSQPELTNIDSGDE